LTLNISVLQTIFILYFKTLQSKLLVHNFIIFLQDIHKVKIFTKSGIGLQDIFRSNWVYERKNEWSDKIIFAYIIIYIAPSLSLSVSLSWSHHQWRLVQNAAESHAHYNTGQRKQKSSTQR
jgi:hypothetical protein